MITFQVCTGDRPEFSALRKRGGMHDPDPPFRPVRRREGYLPLEDLGLVGDGATAALVGLDGSIPWMCLPRFDAEPCSAACWIKREAGTSPWHRRIWWRRDSAMNLIPVY